MKTILFALLLAVPVFAQDSMSTEDLSHRPAVLDERTCTIQDLRLTPENFTGLQIFDDATLVTLDVGMFRGLWRGYMSDDRTDTMIDVVCDEELAKRIAHDMRTFSKFGRRWHVIVGDAQYGSGYQIKIVELELAKDGKMLRSYH